MQSTSLLTLLPQLYEAASEPLQWDSFVGGLMAATGAESSFVIALGQDASPSLYSNVGFDSGSAQSYGTYFYQRDLIMERFRRAALKHGSWIGDRTSVLPDAEMERSEFYNDYMRPMSHYHQVGANLGKTGSYSLAGLTLVRSRSAGSFDPDVVRLLEQLAPHLRQAFALHERLSALRFGHAMLNEALELTRTACFAVSGSGELLANTSEAETILALGDGLVLRGSCLRAENLRDDEKLRRVLRAACDAGAGVESKTPGGTIVIHRRRAREPLRLMISAFRSASKFLGSQPAALVFVVDPGRKTASRAQMLRSLYGLTPAEARLCDLLADGLNTKAAAERLRITHASARFVLQQIFRKMDVCSQSALMRAVLTLPGPQSAGEA